MSVDRSFSFTLQRRAALSQQHRVAALVGRASESAIAAAEGYVDDEGVLAEEGVRFGGSRSQPLSQARAFEAFYAALGDIKERHRRFGDALVEGGAEEVEAALLGAFSLPEFSGEEGDGRYLDLHAAHRAYVNTRFGRKVDYATFLGTLSGAGAAALAPRSAKSSPAYTSFVVGLSEYLEGFHARTSPLQPLGEKLAAAMALFAEKWERGEVDGWDQAQAQQDRAAGADGGQQDSGAEAMEVDGDGGKANGEGGAADGKEAEGTQQDPSDPSIDLDEHGSVEKLVSLGGDRLKAALQAVGLKAGGTLQQRAERLLLLKAPGGLEAIDRKHFAKGHIFGAGGKGWGGGKGEGSNARGAARAAARFRAAAAAEARVACVLGLLGDTLTATLQHVQAKATRTYAELEEERLAAEQEAEAADDKAEDFSSDEEENPEIYNPMKLPLGWDGRPIPFWLYKLHGLNREFKCEVCGDYSYYGPRAYERHFSEWRHRDALSRFGIKYSQAYFGVTTIAEAQQLHAALQSRSKEGWDAENMEQLEDRDGNVYSKKVYADLVRQGIIQT